MRSLAPSKALIGPASRRLGKLGRFHHHTGPGFGSCASHRMIAWRTPWASIEVERNSLGVSGNSIAQNNCKIGELGEWRTVVLLTAPLAQPLMAKDLRPANSRTAGTFSDGCENRGKRATQGGFVVCQLGTPGTPRSDFVRRFHEAGYDLRRGWCARCAKVSCARRTVNQSAAASQKEPSLPTKRRRTASRKMTR